MTLYTVTLAAQSKTFDTVSLRGKKKEPFDNGRQNKQSASGTNDAMLFYQSMNFH